MTTKRLAIIGAGELGKLIAYHARGNKEFIVTGFYDDFSKLEEFENAPVLGKADQANADFEAGVFDYLMIGIGYNHMNARNNYLKRFKGVIPLANILHPSSYIDKSCKLGEGIFILPGVTLDTGVILHDNILINAGATVAHHSEIGSNSFLAPGVTVAGLVNIGECSFIGIGSIVLDCIQIAAHSTIGAGAVVTKNTEEYSVSIGIPAKTIKYNRPK
ncbi:MAG: acetyltransferase [Bacteroidia bacterium]